MSNPVLNLACSIINKPGLMRPGEGFPLLAHVQWGFPAAPLHVLHSWNAGIGPARAQGTEVLALSEGVVPTPRHWHLPAVWGCTEVCLNCIF